MKNFKKISASVFITSLFFLNLTFAETIKDVNSEIYSKLKCCKCNISFSACSCKNAKEIKAYVDALVEMKAKKEDIFYKVAKKFKLDIISDSKIRLEIEKRLIKEAGNKRPQIFIEPSTVNFGKVSRSRGKISVVFNLSNRGKDNLIVTNIKTSCGCVVVSLQAGKDKSPDFGTAGAPAGWQVNLKPNEIGQLELIIYLNHRSVHNGHLLREFSIFSNDPIHPEIITLVEAEVAD